MAPKSLPVINSFRLRNHKTGLNCLSIRANCLPTSKAGLKIERGRKKTSLTEAGARPAEESTTQGSELRLGEARQSYGLRTAVCH